MLAMFAVVAGALSIVAAQSNNPTVLCIAGQCLQGYSNTTLGAKISSSTPIQLLPGTYDSTTNPQLLHDALTASSASISSSPGFTNATSISLPLNLALQPGFSIFSDRLYSGQAAFSPLPTNPAGNSSTPLPALSLVLSTNVWIAVNSGSNSRVIVWDAVPDVNQLPSSNRGSLALTDVQSAACSPSCASSGVCTSSGTCQCAPGFTGSSCESCASGFFGSNCQACPSNCDTCDDGVSGTGRCLKFKVANVPSTCNCLNGACGANDQCACTAGFTTASNGTACAQCSPGFFLSSTGDCQACQLGCTSCADGTGTCLSCKSGFSQDGNDRTKCDPLSTSTNTGQLCPDGSFSSGAACTPCPSGCQKCNGPSSSDCLVCGQSLYSFNGGCVSANADGVCDGSNLIADNNKKECDTCGAKCTSCRIPNFNVASTINQKQCTGCIPGFFLSNGNCLESCPSGTTVSSQDNLTCIPCDSSCTTCAGSPTTCLTCPNNQLASAGKCVTSCPSGTFSSAGACLTCHPDCAACSGSSFTQCTSCPPRRPVLSNGRCLPTCSKSQFFDPTASTCQTCDSSCSSCSGAGPSNCLACSGSSQVLRDGSCVSANCQSGSSVVPGLGVCLSELVATPTTGTNPLPTVTGINTPTTVRRKGLEWWQILLMALGCAFIFLVIIWLFRRRQQKKRAQKTAVFVNGAPPSKGISSWRWRLIRFGEKLFGHNRSRRVNNIPIVHLGPVDPESQEGPVKLTKFKSDEARLQPSMPSLRSEVSRDDVKYYGSYNHPDSPRHLPPPLPPSNYSSYYPTSGYGNFDYSTLPTRPPPPPADLLSLSDASSSHSAPSIYSQVTHVPRRSPEPRIPVPRSGKDKEEPNLSSRFSMTTLGSAMVDHNVLKKAREGEGKRNPLWK